MDVRVIFLFLFVLFTICLLSTSLHIPLSHFTFLFLLLFLYSFYCFSFFLPVYYLPCYLIWLTSHSFFRCYSPFLSSFSVYVCKPFWFTSHCFFYCFLCSLSCVSFFDILTVSQWALLSSDIFTILYCFQCCLYPWFYSYMFQISYFKLQAHFKKTAPILVVLPEICCFEMILT